MKNIKSVSLTLMFSLGLIIPSCGEQDAINTCDGIDFENYRYFDVQGLALSSLKILDGRTRHIEADEDTISLVDLHAILVAFKVDYHADVEPKRNWSFSLMNTASACSFDAGWEGSKTESLTSFSVVTLNDFDEDHLVNEEINDLFDYYGYELPAGQNQLPLTDYLNSLSGNLMEQQIELKLNRAPELQPEFHFKVVVELSTGEKYEVESNPIVVTP